MSKFEQHPTPERIPAADGERAAANAQLNAAISVAVNGTSFAPLLAARGITVVVMDDEGRMVRRNPDGATFPL